MKKLLKEYFTFSKKESYAAIAILIITAFFIALPIYYSNKIYTKKINPEIEKIVAIDLFKKDSNNAVSNYSYTSSNNYNSNKSYNKNYKLTPYKFDPNLIDETGWNKIGLPEKTIKTILNYRSKGGRFKSAEDIRKIWVLKKEDADILVRFIVIAEQKINYQNKYISKNNSVVPSVLDINTATVEDFKTLPSLGNLAYKIIKFREKLGGFISINQVKETYGLSDSVYQTIFPYLKLESNIIQKLNINTSSDFELNKHPYISYEIAKAIVIYRTQHGGYSKVLDIKKIVFITQSMFQKIEPYLTVD